MLSRLTFAFKERNQARILKLSAEIGHYISDAHVPLHASHNHNGQFTGQNGIHGYWNDMNEPALGGSYVPDNVLFDFDGRKTNALEGKNVYGFQMARSSYEAALQNESGRRPFYINTLRFCRCAAVCSPMERR